MNVLLERATGLFLDPWLLVLALPALAALLAQPRAPAVRFAPAVLLGSGVPRTWRTRLVSLPRVLQVLGLVAASFALARPAESVLQPQDARGIDLVLCLDASPSMDATDLGGRRTRLDVAKDAAAAFVRARPGDRIGLVVFARYPDLWCPLTLDHEALTAILAEVTTVPSDGAEDATGIGAAVARAVQALQGGSGRERVVVLLTDGEENVATEGSTGEIAPAHAAQLARRFGLRVYAIAVGSGRSGSAGPRVPVDTAPVRRMAEATGGSFHEARDSGALGAVYARIDALERTVFEEPRYRMEDRFLPFLLAALALLVLARLLASSALETLP